MADLPRTYPVWMDAAEMSALQVLTNGEPVTGEIIDAMMPFFAKAWDEGMRAMSDVWDLSIEDPDAPPADRLVNPYRVTA